MKNYLSSIRLFGLFIFVTFLFCIVPTAEIYAELTPNIDWYDPKNNEFIIYSAEELAGLASLVNGQVPEYSIVAFKERTIKLGKDIDMSSYDNWIPIGIYNTHAFQGTFDGCGYSIRNLSIQKPSGQDALFGFIVDAKIKDLFLTDTTIFLEPPSIPDGKAAGVAAYSIRSLISNVHVTGKIGRASYVTGGIIGMSDTTKVENCSVSGEITSVETAGGIIGIATNISTVENCYTSLEINILNSVNNTEGIAGGICGKVLRSKVQNSSSSSNINISEDCDSIGGGILGIGDYAKISSCYSTGNLNMVGANLVSSGGIAGHLESNSEVKNCYSDANVSSSTRAGGIVGYMHTSSIVDSCYATGTIIATREQTERTGPVIAGGIVGSCSDTDTENRISNCVALNDKLETKGKEHVNRVLGASYARKNILFNNWAKNSMSLITASGGRMADPGKNYYDGESVSSNNIGFAWASFDTDVWNIETDKLPTLKNVGLQEHAAEAMNSISANENSDDINAATVTNLKKGNFDVKDLLLKIIIIVVLSQIIIAAIVIVFIYRRNTRY